MTRAILFANGEMPHPQRLRRLIQPADILIAADGGARHAQALGFTPSLVIGDFDSLTPAETESLAQSGATLRRYPPAKDETDLELALQYAIQANYAPILVLCALGGRLDQTLAKLALLADPAAIRAQTSLQDGVTTAFFVQDQATLQGSPGDQVSLLPWGSPAHGIYTENLAYPLRGESLFPQRTRGISNEMLTHTAGIRLQSGLLLCIHQQNLTTSKETHP